MCLPLAGIAKDTIITRHCVCCVYVCVSVFVYICVSVCVCVHIYTYVYEEKSDRAAKSSCSYESIAADENRENIILVKIVF